MALDVFGVVGDVDCVLSHRELSAAKSEASGVSEGVYRAYRDGCGSVWMWVGRWSWLGVMEYRCVHIFGFRWAANKHYSAATDYIQ